MSVAEISNSFSTISLTTSACVWKLGRLRLLWKDMFTLRFCPTEKLNRNECAVCRPEKSIVPGELFGHKGMPLLVQRFNTLPQK